MTLTRKAMIVWILLIILTLASALSPNVMTLVGVGDHWYVAMALIAVGLKGQLIVDYFMELKSVDWRWRLLMSAYCVVIALIIFIIYSIWS